MKGVIPLIEGKDTGLPVLGGISQHLPKFGVLIWQFAGVTGNHASRFAQPGDSMPDKALEKKNCRAKLILFSLGFYGTFGLGYSQKACLFSPH